MRGPLAWWRERRERLAVSRRAIEQTESVMRHLIEQEPEVRRLGIFAREEIERNHFSEMFAEIATRRP